jgi:sarcosine oxidase subunit beta
LTTLIFLTKRKKRSVKKIAAEGVQVNRQYDAIIIGAGIIGAAIAFELAKSGYKTLNVDKLPSAGYGSTSGSCAIIRFHYSTPDGVATAREGYYYWINWPEYLEVADELGLANYINTGCLVIKTELNKYLKNVMASLDDLEVAYEELDIEGITKKVPFLDTRKYFPVKLPDDADFGEPTGNAVEGAIFVPESGYITDPQLSTHNLQRAAEAKDAEFMFNAEVVGIRKKDDRVSGITLQNGTQIDAPIVINVAGPHSYIINRMAGVEEGMKIKTRALRQEVCHVPAPDGIDYQKEGTIISDGDIGCYSRPETGNASGSIRTPTIRTFPDSGPPRPCARLSELRDCGCQIKCKVSLTYMTFLTTGFPFTTNRIYPVSIWPSALPETSIRMRRWWGA